MNELREKLMELDGVAGVGGTEDEPAVYVTDDSPSLRKTIDALAGQAGVRLKIIVTGKLRT